MNLKATIEKITAILDTDADEFVKSWSYSRSYSIWRSRDISQTPAAILRVTSDILAEKVTLSAKIDSPVAVADMSPAEAALYAAQISRAATNASDIQVLITGRKWSHDEFWEIVKKTWIRR